MRPKWRDQPNATLPVPLVGVQRIDATPATRHQRNVVNLAEHNLTNHERCPGRDCGSARRRCDNRVDKGAEIVIVEIGDFGAEELMALYVALCSDLGLSLDQMKFAALDMIDAAAGGHASASDLSQALH